MLSAKDLGHAIGLALLDAGWRVDGWDVVALIDPFFDEEENTGRAKEPDAIADRIATDLNLDNPEGAKR